MRGRLVSFGVAAVVSRAVYGALRGRVAGGGVSPVAGGGVSPAAGESGSPVDRGSVSGGPWTRVNQIGRAHV